MLVAISLSSSANTHLCHPPVPKLQACAKLSPILGPQKVLFREEILKTDICHPQSKLQATAVWSNSSWWALRTNLLFSFARIPHSAQLMAGHLRNVWMLQPATCSKQSSQTYQMWGWLTSLSFQSLPMSRNVKIRTYCQHYRESTCAIEHPWVLER